MTSGVSVFRGCVHELTLPQATLLWWKTGPVLCLAAGYAFFQGPLSMCGSLVLTRLAESEARIPGQSRTPGWFREQGEPPALDQRVLATLGLGDPLTIAPSHTVLARAAQLKLNIPGGGVAAWHRSPNRVLPRPRAASGAFYVLEGVSCERAPTAVGS